MADAFRGLTIRLGADARPLISSINSVRSSASQAQQQMTRLGKALKFDPSNVRAIGAMADLAGDKLALSAREAQLLRTALNQAAAESKTLLKGSSFKNSSISKLASETRNVYAATQKLRGEYNHVDTDLAHIYEQLAKVHKANMKANGKTISFEKALKDVKNLARNMENVEAKWKAIHSLVYSSKGFNNLDDNMFGFTGASYERAEKAWQTLLRLRNEQKKLNTDLEAMKKVEGYRALKNNMIAVRAELRAAAEQAADLKSQFFALGGSANLSALVSESKRLDSALESSIATAREMKDAFKMLPRSIEAAALKAKSLSNAEDTLLHKLQAAKAVLKEIQSTPGFDKVAASTRNVVVDVEKAKSKYANLAEALSRVDARTEKLKNDMKEAMLTGGKGASVMKLADEINKTAAAADRLKSRMGAVEDEMKSANLSKAFIDARGEVVKLEAQLAKLNFQKSLFSKFGAAGQAFRQFGYGFYSTITPAIMMTGRYAIQAAKDIDAAYRDMRKTVNGTEAEFEHLKDAAIDFSRTHVTSAQTMLEIEAMGGQLGIQVQNLEAFAHTVSNLDIATNLDSDTIAQDLGKMATVMGLNVDQYDRFGDSLVRLGNNMPAMESDIMNAAMRFMGMGKVVGLSADQVLAWATAAVATGQKAEAGGSSMIRFMSNMETAVNGNGEALQKWARVAEMSADDFAYKFNTDASGAMYSFIVGLGNMHKRGESVNQMLRELGINNVRDKQLLEGLAMQMAGATEETNVLKDSLELASTAMSGQDKFYHGRIEEAGDAMREAEQKSTGFSGAIDKMTNNAKAFAVELGEGLAPWIQRLGAMFEGASERFKALPDGMKEAIAGILGLVAVIGPANVAFGTMLSATGHVYNMLKTGQGVLTGWAAKLNTMTFSTVRGTGAALKLVQALEFLGSGKALVALAGVAIAVKVVGDSIAECVKRHSDYNKATDGLVQATGRAKSMLGGFSKDMESLGKATYANTKSWDQLASDMAATVDGMNERSEASEKEIAKLRAAQDVIDKYTNTSLADNLTAQGQLAAAIDIVNDKCGTNYKVVDALNGKIADENGKLLESVDAIDKYIDEMERKIQADTLAADYAALEEQKTDLFATLAKQQDMLTKMQNAKESGNGDFNQDDFDSLFDEYTRTYNMLTTLEQEQQHIADAIATTNAEMQHQEVSVEALANKSSALINTFKTIGGDNWATSLQSFSKALQDAGVSQQEFESLSETSLIALATAWANNGADMEKALESVNLKARSLQEAFSVEMGADSFADMCARAGQNTEEFAQALNDAGLSAQLLGSLGSDAFLKFYEAADGNLNLIKNEIDAISQANIEPKNVEIEDGQLVWASGELIDFDNFQIGDKFFSVTADGIEEIQGQAETVNETLDETDQRNIQLQYSEEGGEETIATSENVARAAAEAGNSEVTVTFHSNASEVMGEFETIQNFAFNPLNVEVNSNTDDVIADLGSIESYSFSSKKVSVVVTGGALSDIHSIQNALNWLTTYKEIRIKTIKSTEERASGGILTSIPRHAAGALNGIVTRATLSNIGWVGEAGAEAVMHMHNAGGAVVPLSNKRYVRPFARAVASEMNGPQRVMNVSLSLNYKAGDDAQQMARDIVTNLENMMNMEA